MQSKLVALAISLSIAGCGTLYSGDAILDKSQEKSILSKEFGSVINKTDGNVVVVASKQYVLNVFKMMSEKHKHEYEVIWDRRSAFVQYTADKLYKINIHPGNTTEINESYNRNTFETYAYIEFEDPKGILPQFKQQLIDAFKEEQLKHDPHEHINGIYTANLKVEDVKSKLEQFFKKLYPSAIFKTETVYGKVYSVVSVRRGETSGVESFDNIYYLVKDLGHGQSQIQLHSGNVSAISQLGMLGMVPKEQSQQLLDTIVRKLGL